MVKVRPYDTAEILETEEDVRDYLNIVAEDGDPALIARALGVVARARGISELARKTGLTRQTIYKALSGDGRPEFATIMKVSAALGLRLSFAVEAENPADSDAA